MGNRQSEKSLLVAYYFVLLFYYYIGILFKLIMFLVEIGEYMGKYGFKDLQVWKESKDLAVEVYNLTSSGEINRDFELRNQVRRSATSIPCNIAEGDERGTDKDAVRFFFIAKGSLAELVTQFEIAKEVGYITEKQLDEIEIKCSKIGKMLGALIKSRSIEKTSKID